MEEDDRRPVAGLVAAERDAVAVDVEWGGNGLLERIGGCNL